MDIIKLLDNKELKATEKRAEIEQGIADGIITIEEIQALSTIVDDKKMTLVLEAMEAVCGKNPAAGNLQWLNFVQDYILSKSNNLKRESSRIVGNIAHLLPNNLSVAIPRLIENTKSDGTVVRWGSAYALTKIVQIPQHAKSELYETIVKLCEAEQNNGVKNQYFKGLKKAAKLREIKNQ